MAQDSTKPVDQAGQPKDGAGTPDHLGSSGKEGQPRSYAETAVEKLSENPLPHGSTESSRKSES